MVMTNEKKKPPIVTLHYKKGELIIKEGDYGISIYKVIKGKVRIFSSTEDRDISLAILGPGEIIGEMEFLSQGIESRSASAMAMQDSVLEVWHIEMLSSEYAEMPIIIKHLAVSVQKRLSRMINFITQMSALKEEDQEAENTFTTEKEKIKSCMPM